VRVIHSLSYTLQTRLLGILSFFYGRKVKFNNCDRFETLCPLNNRINLSMVYCLQHVL